MSDENMVNYRLGTKAAASFTWGRLYKRKANMVSKRGKLISIAHLTLFVLFVFWASRTNCLALPVDMGIAGPSYWTVLETGTGTISQTQSTSKKKGKKHTVLSTSQVDLMGNVGITQKGQISDSGEQFAGDLYLGDTASAQFSGTYTNNSPVAGMVHMGSGATISPSNSYSFNDVFDTPQPMLDQVQLDAIAASAAAANLPSTSTLSQINLKKHHTLTLAPGIYNLTNFKLTHATLTLSGSGSFVFNISSAFALKYGQVLLAGGATESNVLFNYTGTSDITFSGKNNASVLHGIILALNANVNLTQGLVVGEIISGRNISMGPGAMIQAAVSNVAPPFGDPDPERVPEQTSTIVLSIIALGVLAVFRSFLACNLAARAGRAKV